MPLQFSRFLPQLSIPPLPPYGFRNTHHHGSFGATHVAAPPDAITPYLGPKSRLSQVWLNKWTILILLVLARVLIAIGSLDDNMASAKREALSACTSVESMGSAMASMPHYMAYGVNEMTASGVEMAVHALMSMLDLIVTGVENIIVFFVNVLTQTYLCLITLVVRGSVELALNVIEDLMDFLNKTAKAVGGEIADGISGFEDKLEDFLSGINTITSVFGADWDVPELDFSSAVDKLNNLQLPSSIDETIDKINNSIPTFDEVNKFTNDAIRFPFEQVKKLINESMDDFTFDRTLLPVPEKETMSFCSDNDGINSFFDSLKSILSTAQKIFIGVLVVAAIVACFPMAWKELKRWQVMKERSQIVQKDAHDPLDVVYIVSRPYTSRAGLKLASYVSPGRKHVLTRWVVAYVTSPPALFVLSLGIAGLFSCACQMILLHAVKKEVPGLSAQVGAFAEKIVTSLTNVSEEWANSTNAVIEDVNRGINEDVFGWVNTTTTSMNNSLNVFVEKTSSVLEDTFGGTILHDPVKEVLNCLIMLKIAGIQRGLTWVNEHAHVDFPGVPLDTFSIGAAETISNDTSFLANPGEETTDAISAAVLRVTDSVESGIRTEVIISSFILLIWVVVLLCALLRACMLSFRRDKTRGEGGVDAVYHPPTLPTDGGARAGTADGFTNIQLSAVPRYSATPNVARSGSRGTDETLRRSLSSNEEYYQAQKLGFAKHEAEIVAGVGRKSSYAEVEYGSDIKG
ncbi:hypothetical protein VTO42DRAFT_1973 [Malbranchea cinnamomea]